MASIDSSKDEALFEELFKDRFTEKDVAYCELKSKPLSAPTVVYPWKLKKQWYKSWDYSRDRHNKDRNRSRYDRDNYSNHARDRSQDAESSQYRDRHRDGRDSYRQRHDDRAWNRDEERDNRRGYHRERD
ncbi:RNA guanine-N7 methyltransferase activating subunit-like [Argiope bruennichi]|uniref:Uncharacterized protein n=1 Tax=Argiope bruennichi TaxID=94029 RepID=A0A8T0FXW6_ARGBR|nr:RNA guanine-N7 methyltransferase activating subunit-like [Argiope bruennichi]KAF8795028.1 hypothetical protein HNY73_002929 [Argiope bruennichi]